MNLIKVKGIGEKTEKIFNKLNIFSVEDLIHYYPKNYDIYKEPIAADEIDNEIIAAIEGEVIKNVEIKIVRNLQVISTTIKDKKGNQIKVKWFNMPFLRSTLKISSKYVFRGRVNKGFGTLEMEQPQIYTLGKYYEKLMEMQPIYGLTKGLTNNAVIKAVKNSFDTNLEIYEFLEDEQLKEYDLIENRLAIRLIHFPKNLEEYQKARKRIVFNEFFEFIYRMRKLKENDIVVNNNYIIKDNSLSDKIIDGLPYTLTNAQKKVICQIRNDIKSERAMQRLIQGDVGSGKTIIAFLTMLDIARHGYQGVLMAPTEVLAKQHYINLLELLEKNNIDISVELLTGSTTSASKKNIYSKLEKGEVSLIIGTHAVFQDKVKYKNLALVITDEQHRFGVVQRGKLKQKGYNPHVLVMSATPIPRTLAIILYGDLDISIIDELPASRQKIKNCVISKDERAKAYKFIDKELEKNRQVYVICPMVDESDTMECENVIEYSKILKNNLAKNVVIEYLHGKMRPQEKNEIMHRFSENEINVLVSTTVIEVGINVQNATVMMVENAERFGLASLHQLRGRVGRGEHQSYCIFVSSSKNKDKLKRLEILNKYNDGFKIASEDLKLRGPGDFFGIRQSGDMEFNLGDIYTDGNILETASKAVDEFMENGYELVDKQVNNDIVIY